MYALYAKSNGFDFTQQLSSSFALQGHPDKRSSHSLLWTLDDASACLEGLLWFENACDDYVSIWNQVPDHDFHSVDDGRLLGHLHMDLIVATWG